MRSDQPLQSGRSSPTEQEPLCARPPPFPSSCCLLQASKLKIVEAAQREHKDTKGLKNMTSDIVEEAPEAELWNGDADVSTVGA